MKTVKEFRKAVKAAREVVVLPRFGVADKWVRIAKADALALVKGLPGKTTAEELEMYAGHFGEITDGVLYAG